MEVLRRAANPWGQEVLLGIGWDLFWWGVVGGFAFVVVHTLLVGRLRKRVGQEPPEAAADAGSATDTGVPEKVVRHNGASRLFHWTMAASMFALLITAFVPVMGLQFDWVTIHWIAGLVLIAAVIYHIIHAVFFQNFFAVWVSTKDMREGLRELRYLIGMGERPPEKTGKYPIGNKLYHHGATVATLIAVITGVFMMKRIDTPIFALNQYMLGDATWGVIYVLHGAFGVALVLLVITHVYMAVRPDKWWQTRSMLRGWISREEYVSYHDPALWPVEGASPGPEAIEPETVGSAPGAAD